MSTERGNGSRTRAQKYKNRTVFKNDLYDKTPQQKKLNAMNIASVCQHCKGVIEWKIKYKKYKPLSQPKTCTRCQQRKVRKAYHVLCRDCALETRCCAKCLKSADVVEIEPPAPTPEEEQQLKVEMERLIKAFPERKRRAFLRYMNKGKKDEQLEDKALDNEGKEDINDEPDKETEKLKPVRVPHTRDELLRKIEELKLETDLANDFEDDDDFDSNNDEDDFDSDDEEANNSEESE